MLFTSINTSIKDVFSKCISNGVVVLILFIDCEAPTVANADPIETPKGTTFGEVAIISCQAGYFIDGNSFVSCQSDGSWSNLPTCNITGMHSPSTFMLYAWMK